MDKNNHDPYEFSGLFYFASTISEYSDEEFHALCGSVPMTAELFEKCVEKSFSLFDFENIRFLAKKYPELAEKSPFFEEHKNWR